MLTENMKKDLIEGLKEVLTGKLNQIVLYGSVARGEYNKDSDVDIAIVISERLAEEEKEKFWHWNAELDMKYGTVFSIIDIEKIMLDRWGDIVPFYRNIKNEGIVLWKAA